MSNFIDSRTLLGLGRRRRVGRPRTRRTGVSALIRAIGGIRSRTLPGRIGLGKRRRTTRRRRVGAGIFGDIWNGIKTYAPAVLRATGLASKAANYIPYVGPMASALIKSQGYGRRRAKRRIHRTGRGILI